MPAKPSPSPRSIHYALVLLPMVAFGLLFLFTNGRGYLLRRDENILFAVLEALQHGRSSDAVFTMVFPPSVLALYQWLAQSWGMLFVGRALALVNAVICAVLVAALARMFAPQRPFVPLLALALMVGSSVFVYESTYFRFNLPALACTLAGLLVLLAIPRPFQGDRNSITCVFAAGVLFGCALQFKPLMLVVVPFVAYLLWKLCAEHGRRWPSLKRLALAGLTLGIGWVVPTVLVLMLLGSGGSRLGSQLGAHLGTAGRTDLVLRFNHSVSIFLEFAQAHIWPLLFGAFALARIGRIDSSLRRDTLPALTVWSVTTAGVLFVSFPTWNHHFVFLLPPIAISAALFLEHIGALVVNELKATGTQIPSAAPLLGVVVGLVIALVGTAGAANSIVQEELTADIGAVQQQIIERTAPAAIVWSDDLIFPLLTGRPTDPTLLDLSVKRIISGELQESQLFALVHERPPRAVIVYDGLFDAFPRFVSCLEAASDITQISLKHQRIYWLHQEQLATIPACSKTP